MDEKSANFDFHVEAIFLGLAGDGKEKVSARRVFFHI